MGVDVKGGNRLVADGAPHKTLHTIEELEKTTAAGIK